MKAEPGAIGRIVRCACEGSMVARPHKGRSLRDRAVAKPLSGLGALSFRAISRIMATCLIALHAVGSAQPPRIVGYVEGVRDAEDLVQVPGTDWIIASGRRQDGTTLPGHLYLIDASTGTSETVHLRARGDVPTRQPSKTCRSAPDPRNFEAHGLGLRPGARGTSKLYVVGHASPTGGREALEMFEVDASSGKPAITWVDCVPMPEGTWGNDVVALPEGGFAVTNFMNPRDKGAPEKLQNGRITGDVLEWQRGSGFRRVSNSQMSGANGIEVDHGAKHYFVSAWGSKELVRISRATHERKEVPLGVLPDNSAWTAEGKLIVVGQAMQVKDVAGCLGTVNCLLPFKVFEIDPVTLASRALIDAKDNRGWAATSPLPVEGELWLGTMGSDVVARYRLD